MAPDQVPDPETHNVAFPENYSEIVSDFLKGNFEYGNQIKPPINYYGAISFKSSYFFSPFIVKTTPINFLYFLFA